MSRQARRSGLVMGFDTHMIAGEPSRPACGRPPAASAGSHHHRLSVLPDWTLRDGVALNTALGGYERMAARSSATTGNSSDCSLTTLFDRVGWGLGPLPNSSSPAGGVLLPLHIPGGLSRGEHPCRYCCDSACLARRNHTGGTRGARTQRYRRPLEDISEPNGAVLMWR